MANEKILVVDDDTNICELLRLYLTKEGYQVTVANDGEEGLEKFNAVKPDMVLLDVMMPRMDGLEVCRRIRKAGNTPVMMLTAKGETFDKVLGLELGADDYMVKPFGVLELSARIRSLLRRTKREEDRDVLFYQDIQVNRKTREVSSGGRLVELTLKEFELLVYLLENQSRVVTRDELLNRIWGYEYDGETRTLDMHIRTLRQKLGEEGGACIKTVRGVGYRMVR